MLRVRYLSLLILLSLPAFAAKIKPPAGETINYLCIGQGQNSEGKLAPSAETRVRIRLPAGKQFDRLKEPTEATATLFNLQLHDGRGHTQKLGKAVAVRGKFEVGKKGLNVGHNFDAKLPKAEVVREMHINMGNSARHPSWLKAPKGNKLVEYFMLCQWE